RGVHAPGVGVAGAATENSSPASPSESPTQSCRRVYPTSGCATRCDRPCARPCARAARRRSRPPLPPPLRPATARGCLRATRRHLVPRAACQRTPTDPSLVWPSSQHLRVFVSRQRELTERCAMATPLV